MAPLRRLCLCLCLPLLLPPSAAPAPAPTPRTDWAACGSLSRELSRLVATLKEPYRVLVSAGSRPGGPGALRGIPAGAVPRGGGRPGEGGAAGPLLTPRCQEETRLSEENPKNWPPRIRCSDACDPATLDTNNTRCLGRILQGLQHYRDLLGSDIFTDRPLPQLETTLARLLGLVQQEHGRPPRHSLAPSKAWAHPLLRRLALQRLQSFAAIMSRVFTHSASAR
ncbi:interleukin-23 subunit alpha isoform X1 [Strix aluco]|uniref:interleukin-23 subunit alpha isoform X1 n=1 Tax=Strix aluco TaxID=111821 RepID=UPI003DA300A5